MSSSKLFAFNVSKKIEPGDEKARDQWIGDRITRATEWHGYCTDQDYGVEVCHLDDGYWCWVSGGSGYYICDSY